MYSVPKAINKELTYVDKYQLKQSLNVSNVIKNITSKCIDFKNINDSNDFNKSFFNFVKKTHCNTCNSEYTAIHYAYSDTLDYNFEPNKQIKEVYNFLCEQKIINDSKLSFKASDIFNNSLESQARIALHKKHIPSNFLIILMAFIEHQSNSSKCKYQHINNLWFYDLTKSNSQSNANKYMEIFSDSIYKRRMYFFNSFDFFNENAFNEDELKCLIKSSKEHLNKYIMNRVVNSDIYMSLKSEFNKWHQSSDIFVHNILNENPNKAFSPMLLQIIRQIK